MLTTASRASQLVGRASVLLALVGAVTAARPARAQLAGSGSAGDSGAAGRHQPGPLPPQTSFAVSQLRYERVLNARLEARYQVKRLFRERGLRYPAEQIFMRIFKRERQLELWVRPSGGTGFALLKSYHICALAGELGPKRRQGDEQVPEGFYYIDSFNPQSDYLLSLHLDYPNRSDVVLGDQGDLGGDIYIHGGCNSAGCLALTDDGIKEVYWLSVEARGTGQSRIPVHIFPARLSDTELPLLAKAFKSAPRLVNFWNNLKPGYDYFEREHQVPRMAVAANGSYQLAGEERLDAGSPLGAPVPGDAGPRPLGTPLGAPAAVSTGATSSASDHAVNGGSQPGGAPVIPSATSPGGAPVIPGVTSPGGAPANTQPGDSTAAAPTPLGTPIPGPTPPATSTRPGGG